MHRPFVERIILAKYGAFWTIRPLNLIPLKGWYDCKSDIGNKNQGFLNERIEKETQMAMNREYKYELRFFVKKKRIDPEIGKLYLFWLFWTECKYFRQTNFN